MRRAIARAWIASCLLVACGSPSSKIDPLLAAAELPIGPPVESARPAPALPTPAAPPAPFAAPVSPRGSDPVIDVGRDRAACAVRKSGHVDCWGRWGIGVAQPELRRVRGIADARAIDDDADCILRHGGRVACYDAPLHFADAGVIDVVALGTGSGRCFVHRDGRATCLDAALPVASDAMAVTRVEGLVCIIRRSSDVACTTLESSRASWTPLENVPRARQLVLVDGYPSRGCAILDDNSVRCFTVVGNPGDPSQRAVFVTTTPKDALDSHGEPIRPEDRVVEPDQAALANATQISVSRLRDRYGPYELVALVGGKLVRWRGKETHVLAGITDATSIGPGCAVRGGGSVACWGDNDGGVLGRPTTVGRLYMPASPIVGLTDVSLFAQTSSLVVAGGMLRSVGGNTPLVDDPAFARGAEQVISNRNELCVRAADRMTCHRSGGTAVVHASKVRSIGADEHHVYAVLEDGTLTETPVSQFSKLPQPPVRLRSLVSSTLDLCGFADDGKLWCKDYDKWIEIPELAGATKVSTPRLYGCALRDAKVQCFWRNKVTPYEPRFAPALTDVVDVAASEDRACAVHGPGTVTCWAEADVTGVDVRTVIPSGAVAVQVTDRDNYGPGPEEGCAIMKDRTLMCWGANVPRVDGSLAHSDTPLAIPGAE